MNFKNFGDCSSEWDTYKRRDHQPQYLENSSNIKYLLKNFKKSDHNLVMAKWLEEENYIPQLQRKYEEVIKEQRLEIRHLKSQLQIQGPVKKPRFCSNCCEMGHRKDYCPNEEASKEVKLAL